MALMLQEKKEEVEDIKVATVCSDSKVLGDLLASKEQK